MAVQRQIPSAQSVEQIRARARRRLIGAFVLVVIAVALFIWLFDSTPRPTNADIPIEVAGQTANGSDQSELSPTQPPPLVDANTVQQGGLGVTEPEHQTPDSSGGIALTQTNAIPDSSGTTVAPDGAGGVGADGQTQGVNVTDATGLLTGTLPQEGVSVYSFGVRPANMPYLKSKYAPNMASQVAAAQPQQRSALSDNERRAAALLGELPPPPANSGNVRKPEESQKFVIQVGAYAEQDKVDEVRAKLSLNGYSSYVQEVQSSAGKRIRVRIGPFNGRYAADTAAEKIKTLGLSVSVMAM